MNTALYIFHLRRYQRGATLIVTLILLLVLIVIGLAGMATTILQERMAGNMQDTTQVFEAAEAALRLCEDELENGTALAPSGMADAEVLNAFMAGGPDSATSADYFEPGLGGSLSAKGATSYQLRCLVEATGPVDAALIGDSLSRPTSSNNLEGYRITASAARARDGVTARQRPTVILQSEVVLRD